ncbi:hypothetical protein, partial [Bacillus pseudomycoides]|uniref:hypothetical protein n=1 Tax=Bacillus pseudomycoides TaxID=64104 RepID=UPI001C3F1A1A
KQRTIRKQYKSASFSTLCSLFFASTYFVNSSPVFLHTSSMYSFYLVLLLKSPCVTPVLRMISSINL